MHLVDTVWQWLGALHLDDEISDYTYTWADKANVWLGGVSPSVSAPVAILMTPDKWSLEVESSVARERCSMVVYILLPQPNLDFDAKTNEAYIDTCTDVAVLLVGMARRSRDVEVVSATCEMMSLYDVNNRNMTGVRVTMDLRETKGRCI